MKGTGYLPCTHIWKLGFSTFPPFMSCLSIKQVVLHLQYVIFGDEMSSKAEKTT